MLKIENVKVVGLEPAIRGMRNPMNSWDKSDSFYTHVVDTETGMQVDDQFFVGENDLDLMNRLASGGSDDAKFRRMIVVYMDITAPLYWWKEFDTYKVGTVANSCSTMHKIHAKKFTLEDFSHEHLDKFSLNLLIDIINRLNANRNEFITWSEKDPTAASKKDYWWQMIQLLPSSYNQRRTVMLNYEVLHNIYHARRNHKLDEWHTLCDWIEYLPYSEVITGEESLEDLHKKALESIKNYQEESSLVAESARTLYFDNQEDAMNFMSEVCELWHEDNLINFNSMMNKTHIGPNEMRPAEWSNIGWKDMPFCEMSDDIYNNRIVVRVSSPDKILTKESV